jgi:microcystin-dependent protein
MPRIIGVNRQINGQEDIEDGTVEQVDLTVALLNQLIPIGSVIPYAGDNSVGNWLICDSTAVSRTTYAALFALIGTRFGQGDGVTTFNLPDLRGRFVRGRDGTANRDPDKNFRGNILAGGATGNNVGSLQDDAIANHAHLFQWGQGSGATNALGSPTIGNSISAFNRVSQHTNMVAGVQTGLGLGFTDNVASETRPENIYLNYLIRVL